MGYEIGHLVKLWDDNIGGLSSDDNRGVWSSDDNRGVWSSDDNRGGEVDFFLVKIEKIAPKFWRNWPSLALCIYNRRNF